jgi:hypothetical protein
LRSDMPCGGWVITVGTEPLTPGSTKTSWPFCS